jgi:hypothetical protein
MADPLVLFHLFFVCHGLDLQSVADRERAALQPGRMSAMGRLNLR